MRARPAEKRGRTSVSKKTTGFICGARVTRREQELKP